MKSERFKIAHARIWIELWFPDEDWCNSKNTGMIQ